jgi:hypothetical protein
MNLSRFFHASEPVQPGTESLSGPDGTPAKMAGGLRGGFSRRVFLVRGSLVAGAAAAVGSVPGLGNLLVSSEADSSEITGAASEVTEAGGGAGAEASAQAGQTLVAHIVNAATGEMNIYQGTSQIMARSPGLAQAISRLAASKG